MPTCAGQPTLLQMTYVSFCQNKPDYHTQGLVRPGIGFDHKSGGCMFALERALTYSVSQPITPVSGALTFVKFQSN